MAYPTSIRGIKRNIVRNELERYNRDHRDGMHRTHNGRRLSDEEREKLRKDTGVATKKQSVFGAIMKRVTHKPQAR